MADDIKGLIERIQQEGVRAAEDKASAIEEEAREKAAEMIKQAQARAEKMIRDAREEIARDKSGAEASLKQAGRDAILSLEEEIEAMLERLIKARTQEALTPQELIRLIDSLVKGYTKKEDSDITVSLGKSDFKKLQEGFAGELKEMVKKGILLKPSDEISGGFIISYDEGKSHFDFTDKALAEYIGRHLKPGLAQILENAI